MAYRASLVVIAALGLAACGQSGKPPAAAAPAPTKDRASSCRTTWSTSSTASSGTASRR
jgi:hypothetical protein